MRFPVLVFLLSFLGMSLSAKIGIGLRKRLIPMDKEGREDFSLFQGATLTLLGIIIGFSFAMAASRYDQRKNYEEEEANAIGTEFLRVDLLPATEAKTIKDLLRKYLDQRIAFYKARDIGRVEQINRNTAQVQTELWTVVRTGAAAQPTPLAALALSGMNDVLNSQGYTQAAWWNHIPVAAWALMEAIAFFASLLIGIGAHRASTLLWVALPLVVSIAFFLIADLDSPRGGLIQMHPQNLSTLSKSLNAR